MMSLFIRSAPLSYKQMEWFWNQYKIFTGSPVPVIEPVWFKNAQKIPVQEPLWKVHVPEVIKKFMTCKPAKLYKIYNYVFVMQNVQGDPRQCKVMFLDWCCHELRQFRLSY